MLSISGHYGNWSELNTGVDRSVFRLIALSCLGYCNQVHFVLMDFLHNENV